MNINEPSQETPTSVHSSLAPGQTLAGCYVLRQAVDTAGKAVIWLAEDEALGKTVSLHFVPDVLLTDERAMEALRHEVKRNRQLIHPNILRIYDLVEEEGWAAVSMDAFDGASLAALREQKSERCFPPGEISDTLRSICKTLDDAHKIQLVHRGLAPENIFVEKSGRVLLSGFGVSRSVQDAVSRLKPAVDAETSLQYMSPQQLDGDRAAIADDVYAFGVLMHELMTGELPFQGGDLVPQIRRKVPRAISERRAELKNVAGGIPPEWDQLAASCLEKDPERRPKSFAEIISKLTPMTPASADAAEERAAASQLPAVTPLSQHKPAVPPRKPAPLPSAGAAAGAAVSTTSSAKPNPERKSGSSSGASTTKPSSAAKGDPDPEEDVIPEHYPSFDSSRPGFSFTATAAAVLLVGFCLYLFFFYNPPHDPAGADRFAGVRAQGSFASVANEGAQSDIPKAEPRSAPGVQLPDYEFPSDVRSEAAADAVAAEATPSVAAPRAAGETIAPTLLAQNRKVQKKATPGPTTPAPNSAPPATASATPGVMSQDPALAAKSAELAKARESAQQAAKTHEEALALQQEAEAAVAAAKKALDEKKKAAEPVVKTAAELTELRKKREEEMKAAEAAAKEAQQQAAEKARLAEEAKKAFAKFESENKAKLAAEEKATAELKSLEASMEAKQKAATDAARATAAATARKDEQLAMAKRTEQEFAEARAASQKLADEAAAKAAERRKSLEAEIAAAKKMLETKIRELEEALHRQEPAGGTGPAQKAPATPGSTPSQSEPEASPSATATPDKAPAATEPHPSLTTPSPLPEAAPSVAATVVNPTPQALVAMKTEPPKQSAAVDAAPSTPPPPTFENSLGMKFAPVGDVLFCIWPTRVKDFEAFATATGLKSTAWTKPNFTQAADHPVVNVTWQEATAFCKWLTFREHKDGVLAADKIYRLPSDLEWSKAVGLPHEPGKTPEARDMEVPDVYPWGTTWPPPPGSGNYTGEETGSDVAIKGFDDGYAWTSPVGTFKPNQFGLYDMGGNVWQWCMDSWNKDATTKVLRGASWYNGALKLSLLSSCRFRASAESSTDNYGFRCVIASGDARSSKK